MKILIIDRNIDDINSLKRIIRTNDLGSIVGETNDPKEGLEEIKALLPDLLIMDLIYKEFDGFYIMEEIRRREIKTKFIVISNLSSKEMVEKAYKNGAKFFIHKPINDFEVETIIKKVRYEIELEEKMKKIQQIFNDITPNLGKMIKQDNREQDIKLILLKLGIMGEKGSEDILNILKYLIENKINMNDMSIREVCTRFTANPKTMEQKMRRTINIAMSNIASLGIEDYMNETFVEYASTLFNFEQVKHEMDYIRGKTKEKGSINMKKFISGIYILCENNDN